MFRDYDFQSYGRAIVGTVSGSSISFGSMVTFNSADSTETSIAYDSVNNRVVVVYRDNGNGSYGTARVGTVSGSSVSFGAAVVFQSSIVSQLSIVNDPSTNRMVVAYRNQGNSNYGTITTGLVSGSSISFSSPSVFNSANTPWSSAIYDSTNNKIVNSYYDGGASGRGKSIVVSPGSTIAPTVSSRNNFIGVARNAAASGTPVTVLFPKSVAVNQSGLSTGSFYYVNPTTSGFTTASGQPTSWSGAYPWAPVAKAVSSSGLLLLDLI